MFIVNDMSCPFILQQSAYAFHYLKLKQFLPVATYVLKKVSAFVLSSLELVSRQRTLKTTTEEAQ
jgi:hypothetical protein